MDNSTQVPPLRLRQCTSVWGPNLSEGFYKRLVSLLDTHGRRTLFQVDTVCVYTKPELAPTQCCGRKPAYPSAQYHVCW